MKQLPDVAVAVRQIVNRFSVTHKLLAVVDSGENLVVPTATSFGLVATAAPSFDLEFNGVLPLEPTAADYDKLLADASTYFVSKLDGLFVAMLRRANASVLAAPRFQPSVLQQAKQYVEHRRFHPKNVLLPKPMYETVTGADKDLWSVFAAASDDPASGQLGLSLMGLNVVIDGLVASVLDADEFFVTTEAEDLGRLWQRDAIAVAVDGVNVKLTSTQSMVLKHVYGVGRGFITDQ